MPIIKYRGIIEQVKRKPVFTAEDLKRKIKGSYLKKMLHLMVKEKKINRIERGKYTILDDPVIIASHLSEPCYLSLWTAMSIRKLTTQIPFSIDVFTTRSRFKKEIVFLGTKIRFHKIKPNMLFGYENIIWKENIRIPVAKAEKIAIDGLGKIPESDIKEIIKKSDIKTLKSYAKLTGEKKIIKKINELIKKCSHKKK